MEFVLKCYVIRRRGTWRSATPLTAGVAPRGQSVAELALAIPVFFALLFGILEAGMAYKTHSAYQQAAQEAVRVAAAASNDSGADQQTLNELKSMLPVENLNNISSVTIYKANTSTYVPPLSDTSPFDNIHTNYIYRNGAFVCADSSHEVPPTPCTNESYWDPITLRNAQIPKPGSTDAPLDIIGIRIVYNYQSVTHILPPVTITQIATAQIEPHAYGP